MSAQFLLRIEAVNLGRFVYDTEDLGTVRGGGLLLLSSPADVESLLMKAGCQTVETVTAGASQCVFLFSASDVAVAERIRSHVERGLREDNRLGHATFVVVVTPESADFRKDLEALLARGRWRQVQQLRLAPIAEESDARQPCGVDLVRPGTVAHRAGDEAKQQVSRSVDVRRRHGKGEKRGKFYENHGAAVSDGPQFANDFHEIAARARVNRVGADAADDPYPTLNDKLAVVYIDGNQFGKLQQKYVTDRQSQQNWDRHIQDFRDQVLRRLIALGRRDDLVGDRWRCRVKGRTVARIETLLWGGDELIWVVPAWQGLATVGLFFDEAAKYYRPKAAPAVPKTTLPAFSPKSSGKVQVLGSRPKPVPPAVEKGSPLCENGLPVLTHACGLVLCHADTPIQGVMDLAENLANALKDFNKKEKRQIDSINYAVLESFDTLGKEVERVRRKHLPAGVGPEELFIPATGLKLLDADLRAMAQKFPRGSVYRILRALRRGDAVVYNKWLSRAEREAGPAPASFPKAFPESDPGRPESAKYAAVPQSVNWLHLAELWDYLGEGVTP